MPPTPETLDDIASLLATAAMCDGIVSTEEIERLVTIISRHSAPDAEEALDLVTGAIRQSPGDGDATAVLRRLSGRLGTRQKEDVLVMLLEVIAADGIKEARELKILADVMAAFRISDKSMQRAYDRYFTDRKRGAR